MSFIEIQKIIFDTSILIAIIAINMTVIGLTSLAETKKIIGVDYGRFLVKKYRIVGPVRIYELLVLFAVINVSSLFFMFVQTFTFRLVHFILLTVSLVFAIYYFFAYIISENRQVKKQIYEDELLGLYFESDSFRHQEADVLTKMSGGSRTSKKLSSNIISYFDTYNSDSQHAFSEVFGKQSIIYDYSKKIRKKIKKKYGTSPYIYRKQPNGIYDISYEYFQLFRSSEQQFKWTLEILRIFDGDRSINQSFDLIRLYNFSRIVTHLNLFGHNESIYNYKFIEYLVGYYYHATAITDEDLAHRENAPHLKRIEKYTYQQLVQFMFDVEDHPRDAAFLQKAFTISEDIILNDKYGGVLTKEELLLLLLDKTVELNNPLLKKFFTVILNKYYSQMKGMAIPPKLKLEQIKRHIREYQQRIERNHVISMEELFESNEHREPAIVF
ncbi:hypothetical protein QNH39_26430 [Neobacillus novalis]|uniref:Uncharacterized protein n=1 Tax=Neobacillus novalis TaxID=220687 RepID=A0AA95SCE3_9BACI|nr:hypothetical protein [Neobacillus novalis]WHY86068.1 hypothetical protein QNH39_26430 [Neobacillus novalis]